jgi:hypothetical protein
MMPDQMFPRDAEGKAQEAAWIALLKSAERDDPFMKYVQELLLVVAQWTQVLSSLDQVTISLVRLMVRNLRATVDRIKASAADFLKGSAIDRQVHFLSRTNCYAF